jgi:MFS family permease
MTESYPDPTRRALITASTMLAAVLVTLDATVANVALPRIQSSVAASPEQIVWVVTSYVIAGAIFTPLSGWLATRYGRKEAMVASVAGSSTGSIRSKSSWKPPSWPRSAMSSWSTSSLRRTPSTGRPCSGTGIS